MDQLDKDTLIARDIFSKYPVQGANAGDMFDSLNPATQKLFGLWFGNRGQDEPALLKIFDEDVQGYLQTNREEQLKSNGRGGSRRRRRPSRKYNKSSKRVFRKKSRSTRRR